MRIFLFVLISIFLIPITLFAQVQMVTRPERENVELTIYSSRDITLVREQRLVTLKKGLNIIQFSWADTLIDPTSIQLKVINPKTDIPIISTIFPPNLPNTIQWQVSAQVPDEQLLEVSYFTSGLTWNASYTAILDKVEKLMSLTSYVNISNRSGEDYENARTRLVVGDVRIIEEIQNIVREQLAEDRKAMFKREAVMARSAAALAPPEMEYMDESFKFRPGAIATETQTLSEYYMYILKGEDTIKDQWRKKKPTLFTDKIPYETIHKFGEYGEDVVLFYQFKNDDKSNLGKEPLPKGNVKVFLKGDATDISSYMGSADIEFAPVGSEVKLYMGSDPEVKVKKKQMNIRRINLQFDKDNRMVRFDTEREYVLEIENYKTEKIKLEIKENLGRDWDIISSSHKYGIKDANSIEFKLDIPSKGKDTIKYQVKFQGR